MKLELKGLTVRYGHGPGSLTAVDGVDAQIAAGQTLGLVGESGCGKSSLARSIVGLADLSSGQLLLDGVDVSERRMRTSREFRHRVQMVFQDPYSSLNPRMTVGTMVTELLPDEVRTRKDRRAEAARLLDLVGLPTTALEKYPHQFSGGQRQRVAIARALAVRPELVIHDEVTSALDVSVQATILNLLRDLQSELGLTYLFISHDLSTVRYMSDNVAVMYLGRIVERGSTDGLFDDPRHPYTKALINSIPQIGVPRSGAAVKGDLPDPRNPPHGCRFHTRCAIGPKAYPDRTVCIEIDPQAVVPPSEHFCACHFNSAAQLASVSDARTDEGGI